MDMSVGAWHKQQQLMTNLINDCHLRDFKEWNKLRVNRIVSLKLPLSHEQQLPDDAEGERHRLG